MKNMDFEREYEFENMEKQIGGNLVSGDRLCMPDAGWRCNVFGFCRVNRYSYDLRKRKLDFVRKRKGSNTDSSFFFAKITIAIMETCTMKGEQL